LCLHDLRRLQAWQRSRERVVALQPCLRHGAGSRAETIRYLRMASRSACETESHLQIARDLQYLHPKAAEPLLASAQSIQRMLASLIDKLPHQPRRRCSRPRLVSASRWVSIRSTSYAVLQS